MGKILSEFRGDRKFERISRWTILEDTIISRNNRFAQFADNYNSGDDKLRITIFRKGNLPLPYAKFTDLSDTIMLDDFAVLSKICIEDSIYAEINKTEDKIRLYKEVN